MLCSWKSLQQNFPSLDTNTSIQQSFSHILCEWRGLKNRIPSLSKNTAIVSYRTDQQQNLDCIQVPQQSPETPTACTVSKVRERRGSLYTGIHLNEHFTIQIRSSFSTVQTEGIREKVRTSDTERWSLRTDKSFK